jgi:anti-sigma factor RsiW
MLSSSPPPGHLPADVLAAYIDRSLTPPARAEVEAHVADCAQCRAELVSAKRLVAAAPRPTAPRRWSSVAVVGAAAAAVVIAFVSRQASAPREPQVRATSASSATSPVSLAVVTPRSEAVLTPPGVRFVWRSADSVVEYTVAVMDADGRARWTTTTADTSVALPDSVLLAPGAAVHWYVDGLKADGRSVGTGRQRFTVR